MSNMPPPDTFLILLDALLGDFGLPMGLLRDEALSLLAEAGLCRTPSSGSGPRVDPPLAELMPDMAEMDSPDLLLDRIKLC